MDRKCEYAGCRLRSVAEEPISTTYLTLRRVCERHTEGRIGAMEFHEHPNACTHTMLRGSRKGEPCCRWRVASTDPPTCFQHTKGEMGLKTFYEHPDSCRHVMLCGSR